MKSARRQAREDALKILFQFDWNSTLSVETAVVHFESFFKLNPTPVVDFTKELVQGVIQNRKELDAAIRQVSEHWRPERMPSVDRNVLLLGAYELLYRKDIPATVTINEMIDIVKTFGSENSASFVNGVLDKLKARFYKEDKAP